MIRGPDRRRLVLASVVGLIALAHPVAADDGATSGSPKRPTPGSAADLLRPPGSGRYDEAIDWGSLPPWAWTDFYGVRAKGQTFVFVVDCSGSMAEDARLERAKSEIRRTVARMRWPQRFQVIFYNEAPLPMPGGGVVAADGMGKLRLAEWFRTIPADGGTDPRDAMKLAFGQRPDAVFLLSDGEFPDGTAETIGARNKGSKRRVPVHCIDLTGGASADLRRIADDSGGRYVTRP